MKARIQGKSEGKIDKVRYEVLLTLSEVEGKMGEGENAVKVKGENESVRIEGEIEGKD